MCLVARVTFRVLRVVEPSDLSDGVTAAVVGGRGRERVQAVAWDVRVSAGPRRARPPRCRDRSGAGTPVDGRPRSGGLSAPAVADHDDPWGEPGPVDRIGRDFTAPSPGVRLVGDITYIATWEGWVYLATVIDLCTKEVVGWALADHMRASLACDALSMAADRDRLLPGAVFHSDRGCQYTSTELNARLASLGMVGSMGRTGVCWDNALAESFFASLKKELVHRTVFSTRRKAYDAIAEYIGVFYNQRRLHSGLGYRTPLEAFQEFQTPEAA